MLEASFATNVFLAAQGTYRGLSPRQTPPGSKPRPARFRSTLTRAERFPATLPGTARWRRFRGSSTFRVRPSLFRHGLTASCFRPRPCNWISPINRSAGPSATVFSLANWTKDRDVFSKSHEATNFEGQYTLIIPGTNESGNWSICVSYGTLEGKLFGGRDAGWHTRGCDGDQPVECGVEGLLAGPYT